MRLWPTPQVSPAFAPDEFSIPALAFRHQHLRDVTPPRSGSPACRAEFDMQTRSAQGLTLFSWLGSTRVLVTSFSADVVYKHRGGPVREREAVKLGEQTWQSITLLEALPT